MKVTIYLLVMSLFFVSCAQQQRYAYNPKNLNAKTEGVFFGKMKIHYNDKIVNQECNLRFKSKDKFINVSLEKDGSFKGIAPKGEMSLVSFNCQSEGTFSSTYNYHLKPTLVSFENYGNGKETYIGSLETKWEKGGINPVVAVVGALLGWVAIWTKRDTLQMRNNDKSFRSISSTPKKNVKKSLLKIPYGMTWVDPNLQAAKN